MSSCINISHPEYIKLKEESGLHPMILSAKVRTWQENNNTDEFPTLELIFSSQQIKELSISERSFTDYSNFGKTLSTEQIIKLKNEGKQLTAKEFLETIITANNFEKKLKSFLLSIDLKKLSHLDFIINDTYQGNIIGLNEREIFENPTVIFNSATTTSPSRYKLHEFLHSLLDTIINEEQEFRTELISLFNYIKTLPKFKNEYGIVGWWEFYTEGMTNPDFQAKLKSVTLSGYKGGKKSSSYEEFVEIINRILEKLGFINKNYSALDEIINATTKVIEKRYNYNIKSGVSELFESNPELANAVYEALGFKPKPDVILPIGTSGSGKSTFIKSLPQKNLVVIEPDAMRVEFTGNMNDKSKDKEIYIEAANRAIQAIKQGKQVVFDTTNLTKDKRLPFIEVIKKAIPNANIQYKLMELNPELAKQRIKADIAAGKNRANVPDSTIDRHAESYKQMLEDIKSEPISNFELTPQQKQQAQQLYSQYIEQTGKQDIEGFKEFVNTRTDLNTPQDTNNGLSEKLNDFLNKLNFTVEFKDDLLHEYNPQSLTDLLYKTILIKNDYKEEGLLKETAYVAYSFLGKKNKIRTDLIHSIENIDNYDEVYNKYKEQSPQLNEYKIKELIVVDFIADSIKTNFEVPKDSYQNRTAAYWQIKGNSKLEKQIKYLLAKLKRFLEELFKNTKLTNTELNLLLDDIANSILTNNFSKFGTELSKEQQLTNYEKTIARDTGADAIVKNFQDLGIILTGSLAIRKQGTLYRSVNEDLHDLDFTVMSSILSEKDKTILDNLVEENAMYLGVSINKIIKDKLKKQNLLILNDISKLYPNFKITSIFKGLNKNEYTISGTIDNYIIDLFIVDKENLDSNEVGFQNWEDIFVAKLKMGRAKDIRDFANYIPFNRTIKGKFADIVGFRHFNFNLQKNKNIFNEETSNIYDREIPVPISKYFSENELNEAKEVKNNCKGK